MLDIEDISVVLGGATGPVRCLGPGRAGRVARASSAQTVPANRRWSGPSAGLVPYEGQVRIAGQEHSSADRRGRARSVAYVPQRPGAARASMNVTDYVLLGRSAHHSYLGPETARDRRVTAAVLERLELGAFAQRPLGELSGGESQRAVLARALVQEAPVLAMDEPTTSLDLGHAQLVLELTDQLRREKGLCVLCAIHDLTLAAQFAERLLVLSHGRAVATGAPAEVLTEANVWRFFGAEVEVLAGRSGLAVSPVRSGLTAQQDAAS